MPRPSSKVPGYRLHKSSGQAIVTLGGHMVYLGPFGTPASKQKYQQVVGEFYANFRVPPASVSTKALTVVELAAAYWKFAKGYYQRDGKPTSSLIRIKVAIRVLRESYGNSLIGEFGPLALRTVQDQLVGSGKSRRYVNYLIDQIRRIFKWGVSQQLVDVTVYQSLTTVSGLRRGRTNAKEPAAVLPVADALVEKTFTFLSPVVADMVRFQRLTGCRPGEVCLLRPCDLDTSGDVWLYHPMHHKTAHAGKHRVICIGPKAQMVIRPYLRREPSSYCFSPAESEQHRRQRRHAGRKSPPNVGNRPGSNRQRRPRRSAGASYNSSSYLRAITRACELAFGMPLELRTKAKNLSIEERRERMRRARKWRAEHCWTPNQLRHSAATEIRRQFGLEAAQVALGHANADVTQLYAERDLQLARSVMLKVG